MEHKITQFSKDDLRDIEERYGEWAYPENFVWVHTEYKKNILSHKQCKEIDERIETYDFIKNYAEKMYVFEKLKDCYMHSSKYINSRIGEHQLKSFSDEIGQRITLEEIENNFNTTFIGNRVKKINFNSNC